MAESRARSRIRTMAGITDPADGERVDIERALASLPRRQRDMVVSRYYLRMDTREVARVLKVSEGTVKSTLARARRTLAAALGDPEEEEASRNGLDDRLARELERAARPADPSGLYEHLIRRMERRRIARKARTVILTAAVVAGSIGGAFALWNVFGQRASVELADTSPTTQPTPAGQLPRGAEDVGIGFPICQVERLGRIDYLGDGTDGNAWTGAALDEGHTCREATRRARYVLAVDHTGDQVADSWVALPFECIVCPPFAATDLDGNGADELIVARYFSIMDFYMFAVLPDESGDLRVAALLVAPPGHRPAGIESGEPLRIDVGGDEGYASSIRCEGYPSKPVIEWSWGYSPIDAAGAGELHVTRIELRPDGWFHVVETSDSTLPPGAQPEITSQRELGPQCGVDWKI